MAVGKYSSVRVALMYFVETRSVSNSFESVQWAKEMVSKSAPLDDWRTGSCDEMWRQLEAFADEIVATIATHPKGTHGWSRRCDFMLEKLD
jgi:hypothetical protein